MRWLRQAVLTHAAARPAWGAEGSAARQRRCAGAEMPPRNKNWEKFVILAGSNIKVQNMAKKNWGGPWTEEKLDAFENT